MKNCGYKRRSKEFNYEIKDILMKNNLRILYDKHIEFDIKKIDIDKRINIILIN
ncbi:hypothetical protein [Clostridium estertheticum]|uniref:hypothetical protein n=1 Tax=Clostridium estertheticum TaxID=238834 RepID=UPI001CF2F5B8|nr:hypothetical protein [Clostridium estertheticum]MCB2358665.1 hypothetical protein [Clostridium estertheticum]